MPFTFQNVRAHHAVRGFMAAVHQTDTHRHPGPIRHTGHLMLVHIALHGATAPWGTQAHIRRVLIAVGSLRQARPGDGISCCVIDAQCTTQEARVGRHDHVECHPLILVLVRHEDAANLHPVYRDEDDFVRAILTVAHRACNGGRRQNLLHPVPLRSSNG